MRRILPSLLIACLLIFVSGARSLSDVTLQPGDTAHCIGDALVQISPLDVACVAFTPTPTATAVPTETPTATPTATATPYDRPPTSTPTVAATPQPTVVGALLKCPSHDATAFHGAIDFARSCAYDHTHNMDLNSDPALAAVFGQWASEWGGSPQVGFPWSSGPTEKTMKHAGFKGFQVNNLPCSLTANLNNVPANCVKAFQVEYHALSSVMDANANFHSYYQRVEACSRQDFTVCGTAAGGGLIDAGVLLLPYPSPRIPRNAGCYDFGIGSQFGGAGLELAGCFPGDPLYLNNYRIPNDPWWGHSLFSGTAAGSSWYISQRYRDSLVATLSGAHFDGPGSRNNPYFSFGASSYDPFDLLPQSNTLTPSFICSHDPTFVVQPGQPVPSRCSYNGTLAAVFEVDVRTVSMVSPYAVLPELAPYVTTTPQGIQVLNFTGFSDLLGRLSTTCTAASTSCVPLEFHNFPVGIADYTAGGNGRQVAVEFDDCEKRGFWCIEFPN